MVVSSSTIVNSIGATLLNGILMNSFTLIVSGKHSASIIKVSVVLISFKRSLSLKSVIVSKS